MLLNQDKSQRSICLTGEVAKRVCVHKHNISTISWFSTSPLPLLFIRIKDSTPITQICIKYASSSEWAKRKYTRFWITLPSTHTGVIGGLRKRYKNPPLRAADGGKFQVSNMFCMRCFFWPTLYLRGRRPFKALHHHESMTGRFSQKRFIKKRSKMGGLKDKTIHFKKDSVQNDWAHLICAVDTQKAKFKVFMPG